MPHMNTKTAQESAFVTVVAWLFIIAGGFATFITLLQNIMLHFLLPAETMHEAMLQQNTEPMPATAAFMISHMGLFSGLMFLLAILTLAAAIGLLLRQNWARITFVVLMIVGIAWNLGSLLVQQVFFHSLSAPENAPADLVQHSQGMMNIMSAFSFLLAAIICGLFGWIAWRLSSPAIKREFNGHRTAPATTQP